MEMPAAKIEPEPRLKARVWFFTPEWLACQWSRGRRAGIG
jgi:hypothetical protein